MLWPVVVILLLLAPLAAMGLYDLQALIERMEYRRHRED